MALLLPLGLLDETEQAIDADDIMLLLSTISLPTASDEYISLDIKTRTRLTKLSRV